MDWLTIAERFGMPCVMLAAIGYAVFWVAKRLIGESGILTNAAAKLFGDGGVAERVTARYLALMEALQEASHREAQFQADAKQFQASHGLQSQLACEMLERIRNNTTALAEAGLHGCDLLEQVERELQATNSTVNWRTYLDRIRESLRDLQNA